MSIITTHTRPGIVRSDRSAPICTRKGSPPPTSPIPSRKSHTGAIPADLARFLLKKAMRKPTAPPKG